MRHTGGTPNNRHMHIHQPHGGVVTVIPLHATGTGLDILQGTRTPMRRSMTTTNNQHLPTTRPSGDTPQTPCAGCKREGVQSPPGERVSPNQDTLSPRVGSFISSYGGNRQGVRTSRSPHSHRCAYGTGVSGPVCTNPDYIIISYRRPDSLMGAAARVLSGGLPL